MAKTYWSFCRRIGLATVLLALGMAARPAIGASLFISDVTLAEGDSGTNFAAFNVTLSEPATNTVSVSFLTLNGTAASGSDYVAGSGTITFEPGLTNQIIQIGVRGDINYETNETFFVSLNSPVNAAISDGQGQATILNDDPLPSLSVADLSIPEGNSGTTNAVFRVRLSASSSQPVIVTYAVTNGTATVGSDFAPRSGSITFVAGTTLLTQTVTVQIIGDLIGEGDETFLLNILSATNALLADGQGVATIIDDDGPGMLTRFAFDPLPSTHYVGQTLSVTITALDGFNNPVTGFGGTASLSAISLGSSRSFTLLNSPVHSVNLGPADVTEAFSFTPNTNITVTHVRHYAGTHVSIWTESGILLTKQNVSGTAGVWSESALPQPLQLSTGVRYRLGYYTGNSAYFGRNDLQPLFPHGRIEQAYAGPGDTFPTGTNSVRWPFVDLRYFPGAPRPVAISPGISGTFAGGSWTGLVSIQEPANVVLLRADDGAGHTGFSSPVDVRRSNDVVLAVTPSPDPVLVGESLTYTLAVLNPGPAGVSDLVLTNRLSPALQFSSASVSQGTFNQSGNLITANLGSLAPGASAILSITASALTNTVLTNVAGFVHSGADADLSNNGSILTSAAVSPIFNGSFETGDFTGWITNDLTGDFVLQRLAVRRAGFDPGFGLFVCQPTDGQFAATHGYGGSGPGRIRIAQDIFVPTRTPNLLFDYRAGWDFSSTPRVFAVTVEPPGGGTPLLSSNLLIAVEANETADTGPLEGELDLRAFAGGSVRISFEAIIQAGFSGVGFFQLDNVRLTRGGGLPPAILSDPGDLNLASGDTATLRFNVSGTQPISYRWFHNGTNLPNALGPMLTFTNITPLQAGLYSAVASNSFGAVTSRVATVTVDRDLVFRLLALRTNGFIVVEHGNVTGDDRGALAVSSNNVFYTGDGSTARFGLQTLTPAVSLNRSFESIVSDLRTETVYALAEGDSEILFGGTVTSLLELNGNGGLTGNRINLSQPIPMGAELGQPGIFAGFGRIVLHNNTNVYSIAIPSGRVTDFAPTRIPNRSFTESWAYWGLAEYFGGALHLVYVDSQTFPRRNISRMRVPDGTVTTLARFTNLADMAVISFSTSLSRWFFHFEGDSQLRVGGDESIGSAKALFTTDPLFPFISREPASQTNFPGSNVVFSVVAAGEPPLTYQWFFNNSPIPSATNDTVTLSNITTAAAGDYWVEVSNERGSLASARATLTVFTVPIIRFGPFNDTVYPGETAFFSARVDGAPPLNYQWRFNGAPIPQPVGTSPVLILTNVQPDQAGLYGFQVTNTYGSATSTNARLTVITTPFIITQPFSQAQFIGSNVTFSVLADGAPPLRYQWRFNGAPIPSATNAVLTVTNVQPPNQGAYSVVVTNRYGNITSDDAELTVITGSDLGVFQITSLLTSGSRIVDHDALTADDRGGIALTRTNVFITGDSFTARFSAADLSGGVRVGTQRIDSMVTDLRTETVYLLGNGTNVISSGAMTTLLEMSVTGAPTGRRINLSRSIPLGFDTGIFAGYGRIVIHTGDRAYSILMPSGIVQDLGPMNFFNHQFTENWAYWGVAEHVTNTVYLVYVQDSQTIVRRRVPDGQTSVVASFNNLSDMASIVVSPSRNRWYFHFEGSSQFGGSSETLGYANATFNIRSGSGLDRFGFGAIGAVQSVNTPFTVTVSALDDKGNVLTNFLGPVSLSGVRGGGGAPVPISPTVLTNFVGGVWTGQVSVAQAVQAMFLRADDGLSITTDSPVFSVSPANDLVVVATDAPDPVVVGQTLTYSIVVTNIGPNSATAVVLTNTLSTNLIFVAATASQGACTHSAGIVRCEVGTLAGGSGSIVTVQTVPTVTGSLVSQVTAFRGEADPDLANNAASIQTTVTLPNISIGDLTVTEGDSGTNEVSFRVTLSPPSTNTVTVNYSTANGTALGTSDYVARTGTLSFPPGATSQPIVIQIRGDRLYEINETFFINLSSPNNAVVARNQASGVILNDDSPPTVTMSDVAVTEGNSGTNNAVFRVALSGPIGLPVVLTYTTSNGTATAGTDFNLRMGTITFIAGTPFLTQSVTIQVLGDLIREPDEIFFLNLTSVSNAVIARGQGIGTILTDDGLGELDHFEWSHIASPQLTNAPIPVTVSARDVIGTLITNFNEVVAFSSLVPSVQRSNSILGNVSHANEFTGEAFTLGYAFTPSETIQVTHVRHYFGSKVSIWTDGGALLTSVPVTSAPGTWLITALPGQVILTAGTRYRVAAYSGDATLYWHTNLPATFAHGVLNESYDGPGDTFPTTPDPARWWLVDLLYSSTSYATNAVTPAASSAFTDGVWSGAIMIAQPAANLQLEARDGTGHAGLSNPFHVMRTLDTDGDGIWDDWESVYGGDAQDPDDAALDPDGDRHNNLQEFVAGTDPTSGASVLAIRQITFASGQVRVSFRGVAGRIYRLERAPTTLGPTWTTVMEIPAGPVTDLELVDPTPPAGPTLFYRVRVMRATP